MRTAHWQLVVGLVAAIGSGWTHADGGILTLMPPIPQVRPFTAPEGLPPPLQSDMRLVESTAPRLQSPPTGGRAIGSTPSFAGDGSRPSPRMDLLTGPKGLPLPTGIREVLPAGPYL